MIHEQTTTLEAADADVPDVAADINRKSIYLSSVFGVTAAFFFGVGIPCWLAFNLAWGAGLGGMCAVWGGPGFGVMVAGARISTLEEAAGLH